MDYSKLSDFEINMAVGEIIIKGRWSCKPGTAGNSTESWYYGSVDQFVTPYAELPDYCNNPADAWPIILESRIALMPDASEHGASQWWDAQSSCQKYGVQYQANPLRAAMIVYLMMQED